MAVYLERHYKLPCDHQKYDRRQAEMDHYRDHKLRETVINKPDIGSTKREGRRGLGILHKINEEGVGEGE